MKTSLLVKSNLRKTKGLSIGLAILVVLAACFLNVVLLINMDFNKNAENTAEKLNTEDAYSLLSGDNGKLTDEYIAEKITSDVSDYEISRIQSILTEVPFADGTFTPKVNIARFSERDTKFNTVEILEEDTAIDAENYIYLPYQYYTGGGFNLGDDFTFKIMSKEYTFKVKGFLNNIISGSNNTGAIHVLVSDKTYEQIRKDTDNSIDTAYVKFKLNDGVKASKFLNSFTQSIQEENPAIVASGLTLADAIFSRTFLGSIFSAILLAVSAIVLLIVVLMLANNLSNFIRENMRTLGALKAIGYTSRDISLAFVVQFLFIDLVGSLLGTYLAIYLMQLIGNIMMTSSGIPYTAEFNPLSATITIIALFVIVFASLIALLRKVKKIEPIVALREGGNANKAKKSAVHLEKTHLPLNLSLSINTTFSNMGQNLVTFIVTFGLVYMGTLGLVLFQNFGVEPKLSLLTFEVCDGVVTTGPDTDHEIYDYLSNMDGVKNPRMVANTRFGINDAQLMTYVVDDTSKLTNQDVVYEGSFPVNDKEIAISGKFGTEYEYPIGSEIKLEQGQDSAVYKVSGYIQTANNSGQEMVITQSGAEKILGKEFPKMYYFDLADDKDIQEIFNELEDQFGGRIEATSDFAEVTKGALNSFAMISSAIVVLITIISLSVITLVLFMLIKTLISKRKKEYGILKALGYTSKNIVFQNAFSFMPMVILAVVVSCITSYYTINSFIGIVMSSFGVMKVTFTFPTELVIIFGAGFIVVSFALAVLLSRRIKKIEPVKLLTAE